MRLQLKLMMISVLGAGLIASSLIGIHSVLAAEIGSGAALNETEEYSLEDMLVYAMEDEYMAYTQYEALMEEFGVQRPFSNIVKAEANHIEELLPLFETYGVEFEEKDWESYVTIPETIEEAYAMEVQAEENNIEMYDEFLAQDIPDDVKLVFEELQSGSENHLAAFTRQVLRVGNYERTENETYRGYGLGTSESTGSGRGSGRAGSTGQGLGAGLGTGICIE